MASLRSKLLERAIVALRWKRAYVDLDRFHAKIRNERRTVDHAPGAAIAKRCVVSREEVMGAPCYVLSPRSSPSGGDDAIAYLHGGCYVFEITPHHWRFCAALVQRLGRKVVVPIYPLAPEHDVDAALGMAEATVKQFAARTLMGDSAGGGMALALAQHLKTAKDVVLLSPWLDLAMDNPDIIDATDPWLSSPGLKEAGRLYRGNRAVDDPAVSPIHGPLDDVVGKISIFIGTRDIFLADCRKLALRNRKIRLFEYDAMLHDFMLIDFLPEARRALDDIESVLRLC